MASMNAKHRSAYTLVELLVVLGIVLAVTALIVAVYPNYSQREDLYRSTDIVRNTLMRARQWALRDKALTGIQFGTAPGVTGCTLTLVQSPQLIYGSVTNLRIQPGTSPNPATSPTAVKLQKFDGTSWTAPGPFTPDISSGDYIVSDFAALINAAPIKNTDHWLLPLANPTLIATTGQSFQIIRQPSTLASEPVLILSPSVYVDLSLASADGIILFNAKGQCVPQNSGTLTIHMIQTDNGSPIPANFTVDATTASTISSSYSTNDSYIKIDASTGVSKILGN